MTGEATQRGTTERLDTSVGDLIAAMRRIAGLVNSPLGMQADGSLSDLGQLGLDQLQVAAAELAGTDATSLDDLAALTAYAKAHCKLGAQAARGFDPLLAAEHLEVATALLAKACTQLETMTGIAAADHGLGSPLH